MPEIRVEPLQSLFWKELDSLVVAGLDDYQLYHIELSLTHKTKFRSVAYYFSDENGEIDLGKTAPVFGMYRGVDKMGLFTSLYTHPSEPMTSKLKLSPLPESLTYTITVYLQDTKKKVTEREIKRIILPEDVTRHVIDHPTLEGVLFVPKNKGNAPLPCVVDMYGVAMGTREHRAAMLAAEGYCTLALAIFGTGKLSKRHEDVTSEYLQEAINYITSLPFTQNQCAIVGTSFGGTLAYHTAFKTEKVKCAASINGQRGHYMVSQLNENGEKLPWTPVMPDNMPLVEYYSGFVSYSQMYGSCQLEDEHMLRFEDVKDHQQFLYIAGGDDRAIDSSVQGKGIKEIFKKMNRTDQYQLVELKGCGHIIDPPYIPVTDYLYQGGRYMAFGGAPYTHGKGQIEAWKILLGFLKRNLVSETPSKL